MSEVECICTCARAHPLPYLANGWADCVQTWCVANDPLDKRLTQVRCGVHQHVRTWTPLLHHGASTPARPSPIRPLVHRRSRRHTGCRNCICPMTHHSFAVTSLIKMNYDLIPFVVDFPYFRVSCYSVCMGEERMKERSSQDFPESLTKSPDSEQRSRLSWLFQRANGSFVSLLQHVEHSWPIID